MTSVTKLFHGRIKQIEVRPDSKRKKMYRKLCKLDSCKGLSGAPCGLSQSKRMFEGMTNIVQSMWAVVLGDTIPDTFGFVWRTETSLEDITVQKITSVLGALKGSTFAFHIQKLAQNEWIS